MNQCQIRGQDDDGNPISRGEDQYEPKIYCSIVSLRLTITRTLFWGADIASDPPSVSYDEIMSDDNGVGLWTDKIVRSRCSRLVPVASLHSVEKIRLLLR